MRERMCFALLLAALILTGCGAEKQRAAPAPSDQASGSAVQSAVRVSAGTRELTDEEVLAAYDRAVAVYEWFDLATLPSEGPFVEAEGRQYQRVAHAGIGTLEELRSYLRSIFSEDVVTRLLAEDDACPQYREIDGALYVQPGTRGKDYGKGNISTAVERPGAGEYLVNITVDLLDDDLTTITGVECYSFPYRQTDGRCVFTEFKLVY